MGLRLLGVKKYLLKYYTYYCMYEKYTIVSMLISLFVINFVVTYCHTVTLQVQYPSTVEPRFHLRSITNNNKHKEGMSRRRSDEKNELEEECNIID